MPALGHRGRRGGAPSFLDLVRDWTLAALRLEGVLIPEADEQSSASASTVFVIAAG